MKPTLTSNQIALMIAGSSVMFPYTFLPLIRVTPANQDVWIVTLLSFVFISLLNLPILFLTNKFRGVDIVDTHELILGKTAGRIFAGFFAIFAFFCLTACMLALGMYIKQFILAETPLWVMLLFLLVPLSFASLKGPGVIGRLAVFVVPLIILSIIVFFLLGMNDMKISRLLPILADSTMPEIGYGAFIAAARFSEVMILFVFSFYLNKESNVKKTYFKGFSIYAVSLLLMVLSTLLYLGTGLAKHANNPFLSYSRLIGGEDMFQRVQAFNLFAWFAGSIIKLMIYSFMSSYILARIINKPKINQRNLVIPVSAVSYIICLLPFVRRMSVIHFLNNDMVFSMIALFFVAVVPAVVVAVYLLRQKSVDKAFLKKKAQVEQQERQLEEAQSDKDMQLPQEAPTSQESAQQ